MSASKLTPDDAGPEAQNGAVALFVSDLHLQPSMRATTEAFRSFLKQHARRAERLYLLGDIFEYWAGDDDLDAPYVRDIVDMLRMVGDADTQLFWIGGNRDFLAGPQFAARTGIAMLPDPCVIEVAGRRIALTHGDAQCTDDHAYMAFRAQVRDPAWRAHFLAQPLAQRKKAIEELRAASREAQRDKPMEIMDVNPQAIASLFEATGTDLMIHGHTHRPALHAMSIEGKTHLRYVLPDWDCESEPRRGGWIAIDRRGVFHRHAADGAELD